MKPMFKGLLFFTMTAFLGNGEVDLAELAAPDLARQAGPITFISSL